MMERVGMIEEGTLVSKARRLSEVRSIGVSGGALASRSSPDDTSSGDTGEEVADFGKAMFTYSDREEGSGPGWAGERNVIELLIEPPLQRAKMDHWIRRMVGVREAPTMRRIL